MLIRRKYSSIGYAHSMGTVVSHLQVMNSQVHLPWKHTQTVQNSCSTSQVLLSFATKKHSPTFCNSCCEHPLRSQEAIFPKKPLPHSKQLKSAVTMVNISDLIGTTSNWTAVSWVQQALFISPYCVRTLHQPTLFFYVKGKKISHEYKVMLPYKIMQFCSLINFMKLNEILHINFISIKSTAIWDEAPSFWLCVTNI